MNLLLDRYKSLLLPDRMPNRHQLGLLLTPVLIALILLLLDRYGIQQAFYRHFVDLEIYRGIDEAQRAFAAQIHFSASCIALFVVMPLLFHAIFPLDSIHAYGLSMRSAITHFPVYAVMLLMMMPVLWFVSASPRFYQFYPMYKPTGISDWMVYELIYMLQFFAVEFFFRGFCLFRLERFAGLYAIPLMVIPYALIHIYKPLPEALGSIAGGLILGYLAVKTRSIWPGFFVHCGIALSMDTFALIRSGWFAG
ncbi:MAG: CPBP family intramembrane glutamic endopeptidase [bacterium]